MGTYAAAARRRVYLATVLLRPPSGHRRGRRQARHALIPLIGFYLTQAVCECPSAWSSFTDLILSYPCKATSSLRADLSTDLVRRGGRRWRTAGHLRTALSKIGEISKWSSKELVNCCFFSLVSKKVKGNLTPSKGSVGDPSPRCLVCSATSATCVAIFKAQ